MGRRGRRKPRTHFFYRDAYWSCDTEVYIGLEERVKKGIRIGPREWGCKKLGKEPKRKEVINLEELAPKED